MAIDPHDVKAFWDARADTYGNLPFESIANLEQDPSNLALKINHESEKVFAYIGDCYKKSIVDLGAGVGQWAFRFVQRHAGRVVAVEFSARLAEIGRLECERRGIDNVDFVVSSAEEFDTSEKFDLVFVSGLFVYLNEDQANVLCSRLPEMCAPSGRIIVRDGTGHQTHFELHNAHSDHLNTRYSAIYRTRDEYESLFAQHGMSLLRDEDMFPAGSPLNKYQETRLRLYEFATVGS